MVALFTRAWIEIGTANTIAMINVTSPSSRGRGLKCVKVGEKVKKGAVALFTRAWIEMPPFF